MENTWNNQAVLVLCSAIATLAEYGQGMITLGDYVGVDLNLDTWMDDIVISGPTFNHTAPDAPPEVARMVELLAQVQDHVERNYPAMVHYINDKLPKHWQVNP